MAAMLKVLPSTVWKFSAHSFTCAQQYSASFTSKCTSTTTFLKCVPFEPQLTVVRAGSTFFLRTSAEQLWKGMTSVSPAGRKKGRARGLKKRVRDLNKGQVIGFGDKNMLWPGLNSPIIRGQEVVRQQELPPDETRKQRIYELRDRISSSKSFKLTPLERGWSGTKLPGRSIGPPEPVGDETFEEFDSRVLQFKAIWKMSGMRGRVKTMKAFVVVGNKNGLGGFALAASVNGTTAANCAKNSAVRLLRFIPRENDHTVVHDFCNTFGSVTVTVRKKPPGFGLVCHRVIRSICEVIGIKDLYAKVQGASHNEQNITKAFFIGLMKQKKLQDLAAEKGLHLVELQKARDSYPVVVASPPKCRTKEEIGPHENLNYFFHVQGQKELARLRSFRPFYINFPSYIKAMKDRERFRNHRKVMVQLAKRHGALTSFLYVKEKGAEEIAKLPFIDERQLDRP